MNLSEAVIKRFWDKVDRDNVYGCWEWKAYFNKGGYGVFNIGKGLSIIASRMAFQLTKGEIINDLFVLHTCDNPRCCNPAHLYLGTDADNARDKKVRGRSVRMFGESNGRHKITSDQVLDIRSSYCKGGISMRVLANKYDIHQSQIWRIVHGLRWAII
jgi:hypothetical protein